MERYFETRKRIPIWFSERTGGINLAGALLQNSNFSDASMWRGDYEGAEFDGAELVRADLGDSRLINASLRGSRLTGAILTRAKLDGADLSLSWLTHTDLSRTNLSVAKSLHGARLKGASLQGSQISRTQLDGVVGEELDRDYAKASEAFLALKNGFLSQGRYDDASWAYQRERHNAGKAEAPWQCRRNFAASEIDATNPSRSSDVRFIARHTFRWLMNIASRVSCGYGERPVRTLLWIAPVVLVFGLLFWSTSALSVKDQSCLLSDGSCSIRRSAGVYDALLYSGGAFVTIGFTGIEATTALGQFLTILEALIGVSILALVMFTIGNQIARA